MKTKALVLVSFFLILLGLGWISSSVRAAPGKPQSGIPSPTPGLDGRIIYIVKAEDNCTSISMLFGVTVDYLRLTNQLNANCDLREGQELILGITVPSAASPTPGSSPSPTIALPTAPPGLGGIAKVCVLVYEDVNGDGLRQTTENAIPGAVISLTSLEGTYSETLTTAINPDATAYQGMCFTNVPMGKYNVSAAAPDGYNPTINLTSSVDISAGDTDYIDYGAQSGTVAGTDNPGKKRTPLLGILGVVLLLSGIGMGVYVWSSLRKK